MSDIEINYFILKKYYGVYSFLPFEAVSCDLLPKESLSLQLEWIQPIPSKCLSDFLDKPKIWLE